MSADRKALRNQLAERLFAAGAFHHASRLGKCGEQLPLLCTSCGRTHLVERRCDLKWCPACQPVLARRTIERYQPVMSLIQWPLFVTFTARNYANAEGAREVRRAFTKLRRHRWWKKCVRGGVAQVELVNTGKGWHPHVHALIDCRWLAITVAPPRIRAGAQKFREIARTACGEVAAAWSDALGRRGSVKVRRVWVRDGGNITDAMREVLKYSVTSETLERADSEVIAAIDALDRMRQLVSWGTLYRRPELKRPKRPLACECGAIGEYVPESVAVAWARRR